MATPLAVDGYAPSSWCPCPTLNRKNDTQWQSEEASLCNNSLVYYLCGGLHTYKSIKTATVGEKLAFWTEEFSIADFDFDNYRASLGILYSSRLILLYSDYLGGRQTVENHLVHTGTSSYQSGHIMTASIYILAHFFTVFIFAEQVCPWRKVL